MRTLPAVVCRLTHNFDAWIVGSAADPEESDPRDYDLLVPYHQWHKAVSSLPLERCVPNSFGGWKFTDAETGKSIDVWPGDLSWMALSAMFKYAWHPLTGKRLLAYISDPNQETDYEH